MDVSFKFCIFTIISTCKMIRYCQVKEKRIANKLDVENQLTDAAV